MRNRIERYLKELQLDLENNLPDGLGPRGTQLHEDQSAAIALAISPEDSVLLYDGINWTVAVN